MTEMMDAAVAVDGDADWERAKETLLSDDALGCAVCRDGVVLTGTGRGVKPLLQWLAEGRDLHGYRAADRIVGKAAALLYARLGVGAVYAQTMSEGGLAALRGLGIAAAYGVLVPMILNRRRDGMCPIERSVQSIDDPAMAEAAARAAVADLMSRRGV